MEEIYISKIEYQELVENSLKLQALQNNGVDNWEYYDDAMDEYEELLENYSWDFDDETDDSEDFDETDDYA